MMTKTGAALVVTLAVCVVPGAMAHPHTHHTHTGHRCMTHTHGGVYPCGDGYQCSGSPEYTTTVPTDTPYRGWQCVTDEGQGRFLPCDMGGG